MRKWCWILAWLLVTLALAQSPPAPRFGPRYVPEPGGHPRLNLRRVQGLVRDQANLPIAGVALALYGEAAPHPLIAVLASGSNGKFDFGAHVPAGEYQLVAQYPGLCTAHVPIAVQPRARHSRLEIEMDYPGLQVCGNVRAR